MAVAENFGGPHQILALWHCCIDSFDLVEFVFCEPSLESIFTRQLTTRERKRMVGLSLEFSCALCPRAIVLGEFS